MRPANCVFAACPATDRTICPMCINRNSVAHRGYSLIQSLEALGCSPEWTKAVVTVGEFVDFAAKELERATNSGLKRRSRRTTNKSRR